MFISFLQDLAPVEVDIAKEVTKHFHSLWLHVWLGWLTVS